MTPIRPMPCFLLWLLLAPALSARAQPAGPLLPPDAAVMPRLATVARSLADRFSDRLDLRDYGARCDNRTDDTAAFRDAIAVATGRLPPGGAPGVLRRLRDLPGFLGIGPAPNGAATLVLPAGTCRLSATLSVSLRPQSALALVGAGTSATQLVWNMPGDGLDIAMDRGSGGNDIAHSAGGDPSYQGQALLIRGIAFQTSFAGPNPGIALFIRGVKLTLANQAPQILLQDLSFTNRGGWPARHSGWSGGLRYLDPDNLVMDRLYAVDESGEQRMQGFAMESDSPRTPSGGFGTGHGLITCESCNQTFGRGFFSLSGLSIQAVWLDRPNWAGTETGIDWIEPGGGSNSGSLSVMAASGGSNLSDLHVAHIGTVSSQGSFFYPFAPRIGQDWHGEWLDGVDWANISGDTIDAPPAGMLGAGTDAATAFGLSIVQGAVQPDRYDGLPSLVSDVSVAGSDIAFSAEGPQLVVQGGICGRNASHGRTTRCLRDSYDGPDPARHPQFLHMTTDTNQLLAEAGADERVVHGSFGQFFGGGIEVGMPGIPIPGVGTGAPGLVDLHSTNPGHTLDSLTDFDVRLAPEGGVPGSPGRGTLHVQAGQARFDGPVLAPLVRYAGFRAPAHDRAPCTTGDSGDAVLRGVPMHFFCYAPDRWSRIPLATAGW